MIVEIIILFILIVLSFTFSGSETALFSIKSHQLTDLKKTNDKFYKRVNGFLKNSSKILLIILISNTLVNLLATSISLKLFKNLNLRNFELWNFIIMSFIIILFGEILPKTLALQKNISFLKRTNSMLKIFAVIIYPLVIVINAIDLFFINIIKKNFPVQNKNLTKEEMFTLLYKSSEMKDIDRDENIIYKNFIRLLDKDIKSIVIYRSDIEAIDITDKENAIKDILKNYKRRYIPVYENSIDNFKGVVDIYNLFDTRKEGLKESILENLEKPVYLPETIKLSALLKEMGQEKIIFIVDEYGDIQGMLDSQKIMNDFFTLSSVFIKQLGKNRYEINPQTALYEIELYFEKDMFNEQGNKSIIEYFLEQLNRIPKKDDIITIGNIKIQVKDVEEFRVKSFVLSMEKDDLD